MTAWHQLKNALSNGKVGRRQFLQQASALGVSAAIAGPFAAGVGHAATPKSGGRLRVGLSAGSTTDTMDPGLGGSNGYMSILTYATNNHLGDVGNSGVLEPELAESWEVTDRATKWTFKLRKGVEFHNGKTLHADDVVASFNYHRSENSKSKGKALLADVEEIKADGPDTVTFRLKTGNADFNYTASETQFSIMPSEEGKVDWANGIASGPYMLQDFDPGVRAFAIRNPNYWKEGRPYFDELELLSIADHNARSTALISGTVDVIDRVDPKTAHLLERQEHIKVEETKGMLHYTFPMMADVAPFDSKDVRLALKYAFDREQMVKTIFNGHGSVGNDHPFSTVSPYYNAELEQRQYDPDKARFHMKRAGHDSLAVSIHAADAAFLGAVDTCVLYREQAAKAGIDIKVVREPSDGYWSNVWSKKPWSAAYWLGRASADSMLFLGYGRDATWNDTHWEHDRFRKLAHEARAESDEAKRREMYQEIQVIIRDEGSVIIPMFGNYIFASSTKLQHGEMRGDRDLDGQKFTERWWFS
ncbi:MAG: ABC transporter substrate-binding protein [Proteobacteria bacterium]|nr:ABC transporter substrate-binding protein [Pseudomonadota bacterium]